jgi:hypothetical protein
MLHAGRQPAPPCAAHCAAPWKPLVSRVQRGGEAEGLRGAGGEGGRSEGGV